MTAVLSDKPRDVHWLGQPAGRAGSGQDFYDRLDQVKKSRKGMQLSVNTQENS